MAFVPCGHWTDRRRSRHLGTRTGITCRFRAGVERWLSLYVVYLSLLLLV